MFFESCPIKLLLHSKSCIGLKADYIEIIILLISYTFPLCCWQAFLTFWKSGSGLRYLFLTNSHLSDTRKLVSKNLDCWTKQLYFIQYLEAVNVLR